MYTFINFEIPSQRIFENSITGIFLRCLLYNYSHLYNVDEDTFKKQLSIFLII